ncbi:bactericidal permeability-increasing protein-like [Littorina saxatilis]|uniref:Bactericidal permeability-increasing protein n=1 Tax=Littorina saxatilis TaxID=31220 RepID=A0AAN9BWZ8_9CAEN
MLWWTLLTVLLTVSSGVVAVKPGFKARITEHALEYANHQAIDALAAMVPKASIPDQSGSSGDVDYTLSNIRITGFNKPSSSIKIVPGTGLKWSAANAGVSLHADWRVKYKKGWFKVSTSGSVDVSANGIGFSVTMALGDDSSGRPAISSAGCSCSVGGVDIHIHGDIAFIVNLFKHEIEKRVRSMIPGKLCDVVNQQINANAENQLKKLKVMTPLANKKFMLDYRLVSAPAFQSAYMETFHKGEITWTANPQTPPFSPPAIPPYAPSSNMLYLWVEKYVPQSFLYAAQQNGYLRYNLTTKDLPPNNRGFLNTTCSGWSQCIGHLLPAVGKKYPNTTVELQMLSTSLPAVNMSPGKLEASFAGEIALYANTPSVKKPYLLTLSVSAIFNMSAGIVDQLVKGNISGSSFKVAVKESAVGPLSSKVMNTMVGLAMKLFIIPEINKQGEKGFPLPVTGDIKFLNTQLHILQDALMIGTDLQYTIKF